MHSINERLPFVIFAFFEGGNMPVNVCLPKENTLDNFLLLHDLQILIFKTVQINYIIHI